MTAEPDAAPAPDTNTAQASTPAPDGGRVVPVYALTGGRTRAAAAELPFEALVTATGGGGEDGAAADLLPEYRQILAVADRPVSLVEIGVALGVPVGVARVLVGDLAAAGHLAVHAPPATTTTGGPAPELLTRLLEGLRGR